jgi:hypothetical protein
LKGGMSHLAIILASRSSKGDLPVRIASWRSWWPNHPLQSRIEPFEMHRHVHQIVPKVYAQFRDHRFSRSREIGWPFSDHALSNRSLNGF